MSKEPCEYAIIRKDIYGNPVYAKCKPTNEDCWIYDNKYCCSSYRLKEKSKNFFYKKGQVHCIEDLIKEIE